MGRVSVERPCGGYYRGVGSQRCEMEQQAGGSTDGRRQGLRAGGARGGRTLPASGGSLAISSPGQSTTYCRRRSLPTTRPQAPRSSSCGSRVHSSVSISTFRHHLKGRRISLTTWTQWHNKPTLSASCSFATSGSSAIVSPCCTSCAWFGNQTLRCALGSAPMYFPVSHNTAAGSELLISEPKTRARRRDLTEISPAHPVSSSRDQQPQTGSSPRPEVLDYRKSTVFFFFLKPACAFARHRRRHRQCQW
eukprot:COSAG01_NODE_34_length_34978_cov_45.798475_18_plen_249_part_00